MAFIFVLLFTNLNAQLKVLSDGNVGVKTIAPLSSFQINDNYTKIAFGHANALDLHWGTSYVGFNAVRRSNGNWLCTDDGTNNGGSLIFGKLDGSIVFCPINSTGNVQQNLSDSYIYSKRIFEVKGDGSIILIGNHWTEGLVVKNDAFLDSYNMISIYPKMDWWGELGTARSRFGGAYIDHIWYGWLTSTSDANIKENIRDISHITDKIVKLRPVNFDFKASYYDSVAGDYKNELLENRFNRVGLIAQEVQDIFPELVCSNGNNGLLGINYIDFIPYIIQALKEQHSLIDSLQQELIICCENNKNINSSSNSKSYEDHEKSDFIQLNKRVKLFQNSPNPFDESTTIKYSIPENVRNANILVFDMQGGLLKSFTDLSSLSGEVIIYGGEFKAGMYMYSLIVDGKEIETKRMILTK